MPLNDLRICNAKSLAKPYKLSDEKGLFLFSSNMMQLADVGSIGTIAVKCHFIPEVS